MSSKRKQWENCVNKMKARRLGKKADEIEQAYLTVQQLSASVEGKAQKYSRIDPLTMVPLVGDKTLENIEKSCIQHFMWMVKVPCVICLLEREVHLTLLLAK